MKKILFLFLLLGMVQGICAQPGGPQAGGSTEESGAAEWRYSNPACADLLPPALLMDEDVVWRRDIYRELDLNSEANAALSYYPVEPKGNQTNLFTTIFRLMMTEDYRIPISHGW